MATLRPTARADENDVGERQKAGKAQGGQARKALGDIGNLVGPFNTRCNVGKENALGAKADHKVTKPTTGVMTRRSAAAAGVVIDEKILGQWEHGRRNSLKNIKEAEQPAAAVSDVTGGSSLSGLLVNRSGDASTQKAEAASPTFDIDSGDVHDPLAVTEYVGDIMAYYRRVEPLFCTPPNYMQALQVDINDKMRAILIDWLVEVHLKFKLMPETLFLTVNIIDRFLAKQPVTRKNLQLVGVTAMLIASKYEEIWAPEVRDFVYISDRAYTKDQILGMEKLILNTLKFDLTVPTAHSFLGRFLKAAGRVGDVKLATYASYLVELSLPEYEMLHFPGSQIAVSAVIVALSVFYPTEVIPEAVRVHAGYDLPALKQCTVALAKLQLRAPKASLVAVFKKYSSSKNYEVAVKFGPGAEAAS